MSGVSPRDLHAGPTEAVGGAAPYFESVAHRYFELYREASPGGEALRERKARVLEFLPGVPYAHTKPALGFEKRVQGFKLHPSFDLRVETISLR